MASLAKSVKRRRKELGISQEEVARRSGVTLATVNRIEGGVQENPRFGTIKKLANGLGVTLSDLLREDGFGGKPSSI